MIRRLRCRLSGWWASFIAGELDARADRYRRKGFHAAADACRIAADYIAVEAGAWAALSSGHSPRVHYRILTTSPFRELYREISERTWRKRQGGAP